jgi:hypothetical protein
MMAISTVDVLAEAGFDVRGAVVEPLAGGISCVTEHVTLVDQEIVVKRALGRLLVEDDWQANPNRTIAEAAGLAWFHAQTPDVVPEPLAIVTDPPTLIMPMAPSPCPDWREQLLADPTDRDRVMAAQLRTVLDVWGEASVADARGTVLDDLSRVDELRIEPFYLRTAARWPEYVRVILDCAAELRQQRSMVHGDFTPKNVLCLPDGMWIIDTEIAHIGNPILDVAAMTSHLILKSVVHRGDAAKREMMRDIRAAFRADDDASLPRHVGVFLAVRAQGVSPARYLDAPSAALVVELSRMLLDGAALDEVEARLDSAP